MSAPTPVVFGHKTIEILDQKLRRRSVLAEVAGPLAVHRADDEPLSVVAWVISHVATGMRVAILYRSSIDRAMTLAAELLTLADWDAASHAGFGIRPHGMTEEQFAAVKAAIARAKVS